MAPTLPILLIISALLILLGVLAITAIILVAKRCSCRSNTFNGAKKKDEFNEDPWKEAGKRIDRDYDEPK